MLYSIFSSKLELYIDTYTKGLKKQANSEITDLIEFLFELSPTDRDPLLTRFLSDYCDAHKWDELKKRGSGDMPYELKQYIIVWLTPRCEQKKMPELRWYYELYLDNSTACDCERALAYLDLAYLSSACDQRTTDLLFDSYLGTLDWGAHHFPDGCIIEKDTACYCMKKCDEILDEKPVSEHLVKQLDYYKKLYACFDRFTADGRVRPFDDYLAEAGIKH